MENRTINLGVIAEVAKGLKELREQMIFVGGAIASLYADDEAADEIRPTSDIDMTIRLMNLADWNKVQERLAQLGFHPDPFGHAICSYLYKGIPIDIMSSQDSPLGPANPWYEIGFSELQAITIETQEIQIFSAPVYLATKFEAFNNRGTDYRTSHDFEDIIYVLDNNTGVVEAISKAPQRVNDFLIQEIRKVLVNPAYEEIISAHIHPLIHEERTPLLIEKMNRIVNYLNKSLPFFL